MRRCAARSFSVMSHPEFSLCPNNAFCGVQRGGQPLWGVAGVSPAASFLSFRAAAGGAQEEKRGFAGTPRNPGRGQSPLHPQFWELLKKFGMTHAAMTLNVQTNNNTILRILKIV